MLKETRITEETNPIESDQEQPDHEKTGEEIIQENKEGINCELVEH